MKIKGLQLFTIFLFLLPLCVILFGTGCEEEKEIESISLEIDSVVSVFALRYGESKEITYGGETIEISIKNIEDEVSVNCALVDFQNNREGPLKIRIYVDLQINNQQKLIRVASKPCGAMNYYNNGHDAQDVEELIDDIKNEPANLIDSTGIWFTYAFSNLFGEGTLIKSTPFKIFIAKTSPQKYNQQNATIDDYTFVFIITTVK